MQPLEKMFLCRSLLFYYIDRSFSDRNVIFPYNNYHCLVKHLGQENKENEHQRKNVLMFKQILPTCSIRNVLRIVRRISILTLGLKELNALF